MHDAPTSICETAKRTPASSSREGARLLPPIAHAAATDALLDPQEPGDSRNALRDTHLPGRVVARRAGMETRPRRIRQALHSQIRQRRVRVEAGTSGEAQGSALSPDRYW